MAGALLRKTGGNLTGRIRCFSVKHDLKSTLGSVDVWSSPLFCLKKHQSRREKRSLVIPNERRATTSGAFLGRTRRAETISPPSVVISHSFGMTKQRSFCLAGRKNGHSRGEDQTLTDPRRQHRADPPPGRLGEPYGISHCHSALHAVRDSGS